MAKPEVQEPSATGIEIAPPETKAVKAETKAATKAEPAPYDPKNPPKSDYVEKMSGSRFDSRYEKPTNPHEVGPEFDQSRAHARDNPYDSADSGR